MTEKEAGDKVKKARILWKVIKRLHFDKVLYGFIGWGAVAALLVQIIEPGITRYGDALWYMFAASTSIGFGDIIATTFFGRLITAIAAVYEIVIVAMFSGVVVSYYIEMVKRREQETLTVFLDKLEHLTELSQEELKEIEDKVRKMH